MAVVIASQKNSEHKHTETFIKKQTKPLHNKTRPITATLEHPLILDIKFLKKLDMTTFTKRGLMALSKFCGISLINKTDTKKKLNKSVKTIQCSKKHLETDYKDMPLCQISDCSKKEFRVKRKLGKQISKGRPRIRFKIATEDSSPDEDSLDVVCKSHNEIMKSLSRIPNSRTNEQKRERKAIINSALNDTVENTIPEPCKTCSRSEHPERFHSHPKMLAKSASQEKSNELKLEERFRKTLTTKKSGGDMKEVVKKSSGAKERENKSLKDFSSCDESTQNSSKSCLYSKSPSRSSSSTELSPPESANKNKPKSIRNPFTISSPNIKSKNNSLKKAMSNIKANQKEETILTDEEAMKFVTGCYICGEQLSPKSRMKHEKTCIGEWRAQNVLENKRRPEPKRPDFRFTVSGDLDCEGTFDSIWANHIDSLIPCKKCGRKFFSDRIERHENCCNNLPVKVKYKH